MNDFQNQQDIQGANAAPGQLTLASEVMPDRLFLLPLSERPFFPAQSMPLLLDENPWLETFKGLYERNQQVVGLVFAHTDSGKSLDRLRPSDFEEIDADTRVALFGDHDGPFPIPLVRSGRRGRVQPAARRAELPNRRRGAAEPAATRPLDPRVRGVGGAGPPAGGAPPRRQS